MHDIQTKTLSFPNKTWLIKMKRPEWEEWVNCFRIWIAYIYTNAGCELSLRRDSTAYWTGNAWQALERQREDSGSIEFINQAVPILIFHVNEIVCIHRNSHSQKMCQLRSLLKEMDRFRKIHHEIKFAYANESSSMRLVVVKFWSRSKWIASFAHFHGSINLSIHHISIDGNW